MKYLLSVCIALALFTTAAQAQDSAQHYVGKYRLTAGSPVPGVEVILQDGGLIMNSAAGSSALRHVKDDQFTLTAFENSVVIFTRNPQGKVTGIHIEAMGYVMEGSKEEELAIARLWASRQQLVNTNVQICK